MCRMSFGVSCAGASPLSRSVGLRRSAGGKKYADDVKSGDRFCDLWAGGGIHAEFIQGVGGFVVFPDGYLKAPR